MSKRSVLGAMFLVGLLIPCMGYTQGGGAGLLGLQSAGFVRGDSDTNGIVDVTDAINSLKWKFLGTFEPTCLDALDADDNGSAELNDDLLVLDFLFLGNQMPLDPGPMRCGEDPTHDDLGCEIFTACNCVAQEDLSTLIGLLIEDVCVPAPIFSENVIIGDLVVCPAGSRVCPDGTTDGCTLEIQNVVLSMNFTEQEVTIARDAVMPDLAIFFDPILGNSTNCAISASIPITATAPLNAPENTLGLFAFSSMGAPTVEAGALTVDPGDCGSLGDLISSLTPLLQAEVDSLLVSSLQESSAEIASAVNGFLEGAQLCP